MAAEKPTGPITVMWALVVCVDADGVPYPIDHEFNYEVKTKRPASLDDIDAACMIMGEQDAIYYKHPEAGNPYSFAFLVFQMPDGHIAASPDIFEDVIPVVSPTFIQIKGALSVLRGQIIAQRTADLAGQVAGDVAAKVAVQATLSVLKQAATEMDPDAAKKSQGGLYVA